MKIVLLALALVAYASADKWDGLSVKWTGLNPPQLPRTVKEAVAKGWTTVGSGKCGGSNNYQGIAYNKDEDDKVRLLFDPSGFIAGIQIAIHLIEQKQSGFPSSKQTPPMILDGDTNEFYTLSAYFRDPSTICSEGRTQSDFDRDGTGTSLYIQNGDSIIEVPKKQKYMYMYTPWVEGKCFFTMGVHHWYDIYKGMDCDEMFPMFLLYNRGELNGFGWAMIGDFYSDKLEHPEFDKFSLFMKEVPQCLETAGPISTMHVFLSYNPALNFC